MMALRRCCLCLVSMLLLPDPSDATAQPVISQDLFDYLFTNYTKSLIPICATGDNVTLKMDVALRQVMEVNEREQLLSSNVWLRLTWNDCRLTWTPSLYNNLTYLMVTYDDIWIPDITLYDSAADEVMFPGREDYRAYVSSSGSVTYNFPTVLTSICRVNVRYFPFDTQRCSLQFGSWSHHGFELDVVPKNPSGTWDLSVFIKNNEWIVDEFPSERHVLYYTCCVEPYPDVTFYVVLERRPAFYLLTMLFPCILVSMVAALTFLLPVESGEKVSLEITVLLSLAVFLLVVSETLPPASDNFPILGSYFAGSMVLVSLSLFQTILVLNVFYRGTNGRHVPRWARVLFFQYLGKFVCGKNTKVTAIDPDQKISAGSTMKETSDHDPESPYMPKTDQTEMNQNREPERRNGKPPVLLPSLNLPRDPILQAVERQSQSLKNVEHLFQGKTSEEENNSDWRDIANIMDRVFLIFYLFVTVITTLAFLLQCVNR